MIAVLNVKCLLSLLKEGQFIARPATASTSQREITKNIFFVDYRCIFFCFFIYSLSYIFLNNLYFFAIMTPKTSSLAIAAFVCGLLFFVPLLSFIAVILGIVALVQLSRNSHEKGKGFAITAIIIGLLVSVMYILFIVVMVKFFGFFMTATVKNLEEGIQDCTALPQGVKKDICITTSLASHLPEINETALDPGLCDLHVEGNESRAVCNAMLKRDKEYCSQIKRMKTRIECVGLIEELGRSSFHLAENE